MPTLRLTQSPVGPDTFRVEVALEGDGLPRQIATAEFAFLFTPQVALQILEQIPVLWIWDNIEPIAGFPEGTQSLWSDPEQQELVDFLRAARQSKAKFLLVSRRKERGWLDDLPARILVQAMPMQERVQMTRALAEKRGRRLADVEDWMSLLRFTGGNPLTITVLVSQALRDGLYTKSQIEALVAKLRAGEDVLPDAASEGRDKSLGASLSYGFDNTFSEEERKQLALLHFFQGFVNVNVLCAMGDLNNPASVPEVRGLTREAGNALLGRAAEIGLLTDLGGGFYNIHPALPWHFRQSFNQYYPEPSTPDEEGRRENTTRAFVIVTAVVAIQCFIEYRGGNRDVIDLLVHEEANLLQANYLARKHQWASEVIDTLKGLGTLYQHTGRRPELLRLLNEIIPEFVDAATGNPLSGREEYWSVIVQYQVRLLRQERQWAVAEHLQRGCVDWDYNRSASARAKPSAELSRKERELIKNLIASIQDLAHILREQSKRECRGTNPPRLTLQER